MFPRPPTVQGFVARAAVRRALRVRANAMHRCVERRLKFRPGLSGRVTLRITIGRAGWVTGARVVKSTLRDKVAERCLINQVRRIRYPKPKRGFVVVTYPLDFKLTARGRGELRLLRGVQVRGGISQRAIRRGIRSRARALRNCYTMLGLRVPIAARLRFVVGKTGRISRVKALGPVARRKRLWTCVAQRLRLLRLPAPRGGPATVTVNLKFVGR
jgi:TonB family protein